MKRYDLLKMNSSVLRVFIDNKIDIKDVARLALFEEYCDLRNRGEKFGYTIQFLANKYHCSARSVSNVVNRMKRDVRV